MALNDLTANSRLVARGVRVVGSAEKETKLNASSQVPEGGIIVVVDYGDTNYVKITDGNSTFSQLKKLGEGDDSGSVAFADITGQPSDNTALNAALSAKINTGQVLPTDLGNTVNNSVSVRGVGNVWTSIATTGTATQGAIARWTTGGRLNVATAVDDGNAVPLSQMNTALSGKANTGDIPTGALASLDTVGTAQIDVNAIVADRIANGVIINAKIASNAAIALSKLANVAAGTSGLVAGSIQDTFQTIYTRVPYSLPATLGTAGQVLTVNAGGDGLEWTTPA